MKTLQSDPKNAAIGFLSELRMIFKGIFFSHVKKEERTLTPIQIPKPEIVITVFFKLHSVYTRKQGHFHPVNRMFYFSFSDEKDMLESMLSTLLNIP